MAYTKTNWTDTTPINKTNLNKIEDGIYNSSQLSSTEPNPKNDVWFKSSKNLFKNTLPTQTLNGITATNNGDGSLTLNGRATAGTVLNFGNGRIDIQDTPLYLDSHTTASGYVFCYYVYNSDGSYKTNLNDKSSTTLTNGEYIDSANIYINSGATYNNYIMYPQLSIGTSSTPFEQYVEPNILVNHGGGYQDLKYNSVNIITNVETPTNEYIDGKRVYIKRLHVVPYMAGENIFAHNISNLDKIIHLEGMLLRTGNTFMPLSFIYPIDSTWSGGIHGDSTAITITLGTNLYSSMISDGVYVTIKYTKN